MKNIFLLFALLVTLSLPAQVINLDATTTRAVVVGISDYQDEKIPDLRFADRDAEAFAQWLRSPAGSELTDEKIALLVNEKATAGKIMAAIGWLVEESKPGDRAVIYFSGHGDVETLTKEGWGYLLAYDAPAVVYGSGGTIMLPYLQAIISTLSEANVQVIMVSDACHVGKLAGTSKGGPKATVNMLAERFSNEIKILSCQPDEFSIEGEEWGGGRGAFSYHLVDAFYGFADANQDMAVNLQETQSYLQNIVPAETSPTGQTPFVVGNLKTLLATLAPETLADWQKTKKQPGGLSPFAGKGLDVVLLTGVDTTLQELYNAFNVALERGELLASASGGLSANDYYLRLVREPQMAKLHGVMTRNLAAALQDEAQVVINQLLRTDPEIVDDAFSPVAKYDHLPVYLARAAELLGQEHFMWRFLKAKEHYFRSKTYRKENYPELSQDSLFALQLASVETALKFDSMAAYAYQEKGQLYFWNSQQFAKAIENFDKAVALSPEWVIALYFAGRGREGLGKREEEEGALLLKKAIGLDSSFLPSYQVLGVFFPLPPEEKKFWMETYVARMQQYVTMHPDKVPLVYWNYYGNTLMFLNRLDEAEAVLLKAAQNSNDQLPLLYSNLGAVYIHKNEWAKAIEAYQKLTGLMPFNRQGYAALALAYYSLNEFNEAAKVSEEALELDSMDARTYFILGDIYFRKLKMLGKAETVVQKAIRLNVAESSWDPWYRPLLAELYSEMGYTEAAHSVYKSTIELLSNQQDPASINYLARSYLGLGDMEGMEKTLKQAIRATPDDVELFYQIACVYSIAKQLDISLEYLETAIKKGFLNYGRIVGDYDMANIKDSRGFKALLKKYFPEQFKD